MEYNRRPWINNWLTDRNQTVGNKFCVNKQRVTHVRKTSCIMVSEAGFNIKKKRVFAIILKYFLTTLVWCMVVATKAMEYWRFIRKGLRAILKLLLHE